MTKQHGGARPGAGIKAKEEMVTLGVHLPKRVKDFYLKERGLARKVLEKWMEENLI